MDKKRTIIMIEELKRCLSGAGTINITLKMIKSMKSMIKTKNE